MAAQRENRPGLGILFLCIGMVAISINDLLIKVLSDDYALHLIVFSRTSLAICISFVILRIEGGFSLLRTHQPVLHAVKGLMLVGANLTFFASLAVLPLGLTTALFYVGPLLLTLFSALFLGERVGPLRGGAIVAGFVGVAIMQDPSALDVELTSRWVLVLPVVAATLYAGMATMTRALGLTSKASAMAIYNQLAFIGVSALFFLSVGDGRFDPGPDSPSLHFLLRAWEWPARSDWATFAAMGVLNATMAYCLNAAYRIAPSATVAPFEYIGLPLAFFWGWLVFAEWPTPSVWAGCTLILSAGLFVFLRERQLKKRV
ncbi:DMT family transporter [Marivita hallyeonensis]|uniref:S-adenosylmethionine uptake transporter n=1 Tax=Marivita hallyeonensis TaxID=996342 RepID=A0A1M5XZ23_9RHOB|nr:DMT family transporter [Marivita hallyeonensis]SHI04992.1 S-adenosylmethionine uptake transporter [Marivita hallyeonensis]